MNPESFGACTRLPLADCPFTRSELTVTDAERELQMLQSRERWDIADANVVLETLPEVDAPRLSLAETVRLMRAMERSEQEETGLEYRSKAPSLDTPFWQRLAWLRKGGSY